MKKVGIIGWRGMVGSVLMERMRAARLDDVPVVVGGIIPSEDGEILKAAGVAAVYTPKDFQLNDIMAGIVDLLDPAKRAV